MGRTTRSVSKVPRKLSTDDNLVESPSLKLDRSNSPAPRTDSSKSFDFSSIEEASRRTNSLDLSPLLEDDDPMMLMMEGDVVTEADVLIPSKPADLEESSSEWESEEDEEESEEESDESEEEDDDDDVVEDKIEDKSVSRISSIRARAGSESISFSEPKKRTNILKRVSKTNSSKSLTSLENPTRLVDVLIENSSSGKLAVSKPHSRKVTSKIEKASHIDALPSELSPSSLLPEKPRRASSLELYKKSSGPSTRHASVHRENPTNSSTLTSVQFNSLPSSLLPEKPRRASCLESDEYSPSRPSSSSISSQSLETFKVTASKPFLINGRCEHLDYDDTIYDAESVLDSSRPSGRHESVHRLE